MPHIATTLPLLTLALLAGLTLAARASAPRRAPALIPARRR